VTVEGTTYPLPEPFLVIATQNPVEMVGTYPLPESQLDRFLITTGIGYPPAEIERGIIRGGSIRDEVRQIRPLIALEDIMAAREAIHRIYLAEKVVDYIYRLTAATRDHPQVHSGISTRGAIGLAAAARAAAYLDGRDFVRPEDVQEMAVPVGAHRLIMRPEHEGRGKEEVLRSLLRNVAVPRS
jgi:MoxR-like ATPase